MNKEMPTTEAINPFLEEAKKSFVDPKCLEVQIEDSPLFLARENAPVALNPNAQVLEVIDSSHGALVLVNPPEGYQSEINN